MDPLVLAVAVLASQSACPQVRQIADELLPQPVHRLPGRSLFSVSQSLVSAHGGLITIGGNGKQQVFALEIVAELLEFVRVGVEPCAAPYHASQLVQQP